MTFTCSIVKLWNLVSQSTVDVAVFKKTPSKLGEKKPIECSVWFRVPQWQIQGRLRERHWNMLPFTLYIMYLLLATDGVRLQGLQFLI